MNILASIDRWGRETPDRVAHVSGSSTLTYGELLRNSDALAANLLETLPPGDAPVMVLGHKSPEMLVGFLGVLKAGRAYIPVDTSLPATRIAQITESAQCAAILTPAEISERIAAAPHGRREFPARSPEQPHYIIFTSGSTGTPKGVVISSHNLAVFLRWMLDEQGFIEGGEVFLNQAPFSFDLSVMDLYPCLVSGGTLVSLTKDDVGSLKRLYETLGRSRITTWVSTPSFAQLCLADTGFRQAMLPALRRFLFCGETLPPAVAGELLERFPEATVWNTYGPTEATVAMTSIPIRRETLSRYNALPVGYPMPGVTVRIVDEAGVAQPTGAAGEVIIEGENVSAGYLRRPDLTAKVFTKRGDVRSYRTGDWGWLDESGLLFVSGRMDGQIKLSGYRIELGDIEANLRELPNVRDAVVLPVLKDGAASMLAAFVVPATARNGNSDLELMLALRGALSERLPVYMIPKKFVFLESFPMTPNGKADRRQLAATL